MLMQWKLTDDIIAAVDTQSVPQSSLNASTLEETRWQGCGFWEIDLGCNESRRQNSGNNEQGDDAPIIPLI